MKSLRLFVLLLIGSVHVCVAQTDTIRICTYNLLGYGNSANPYTSKNLRLQPILQFIKPSIACFNEVSTTVPGLLDTLLRVMPYLSEHGPIHNTVHTTLLDGLFWRSSKFHLVHDSIICSDVRDIVAYDLYYDYPGLSTYHDTIWLTVITAHLKSSSTAADKADRAGETQKVSAYLTALNTPANIIMLGDFNLYTSSEVAYQNLISPANSNAHLNDPLNRPGSWDNNASFADIHTQSTRVLSLADGGASSGLDSRFDFILISDPILTGAKGVKYITGSHTAVGNDGHHYGKAINDTPLNTAAAPAIVQALYECSDHLPAFADLLFTPQHPTPSGIAKNNHDLQDIVTIENPFINSIRIRLSEPALSEGHSYQLLSIQGLILQGGNIESRNSNIDIHTGIAPGVYFMRIHDEHGKQATFRLTHF